MGSAGNDSAAGLKLLGGLLRLDALSPDGFTAHHLAEHAQVGLETARAFLKLSKGPGYAEAIPGGTARARPEGVGRPAKLYRLCPDRRADLLQKLAELRRGLDAATGLPPPPESAVFAPVELLEATLDGLKRRPDTLDAWRDRLAEAQLELRGAEADLRALQAEGSPHLPDFARRLGMVQGRFAEMERAGPPPELVAQAPDCLLAALVERFGAWLCGGVPAMLEPVLVLLHGIRGHDAVTTAVLEACRAGAVRVAAFDVARMAARERARLYASLDRLRGATPLAVSDLVLTLDGRTEIAGDLAEEFRELGRLGAWRGRVRPEPDMDGLDLDALRRSYIARIAPLLNAEAPARPLDARRKAVAARLTSALSAWATAGAADAMPHLPFIDLEQHRQRWRGAAQEFMGDAICLDSTHSEAIEKTFADVNVEYVADAANNMPATLVPQEA